MSTDSRCIHYRPCICGHSATPDTSASEPLSEAERESLRVSLERIGGLTSAVERIVAAREAAAVKAAGERIAQAIEANCRHYGDEACCCNDGAHIAREVTR